MSNSIFILLAALVVIAMLVFSVVKAGSIKEATKRFKLNKALSDWKTFVGIALVIAFGLSFIQKAKAENFELFEYTQVSLGIDYVYNDSHSAACEPDSAQFDDRLTGSGRIVQNVFSWHSVEFNALYQHHSCALNGDAHTYDAFGIELSRRWYW
jgi:hypothetical protein